MTAANRYPRFRAPAGNGEVFCDPSWNSLLELVEERKNFAVDSQVLLFGTPIRELSIQARKATVSAAEAYMRSYTDTESLPHGDSALIATGHQPELFHPGVWYKNFSADRLAKSSGGMALNLIIDSDLCRSPGIQVPTGMPDNPKVNFLAFDKISAQLPYEERKVIDHELWNTFGERLANAIGSLVKDPLVRDWWSKVVEPGRGRNLGLALSQARHRQEHSWGAKTWELPQSILCQTDAFRHLALHLFVHADSFQNAYNSALEEYRSAHHLRNRAQPVPNLHRDQEWIESPFWLWSTSDPIRRPLYVRVGRNECQLTDRYAFVESLPINSDSESATALERMAGWEASGIKIRTRALTTTLFIRLLLADVFIHGIGGAKYDQVTDSLCRQFFGISLPPYATVSATLHLPVQSSDQNPVLEGNFRQKLRDLLFHPERHLDHMQRSPEDELQIEQLIRTKSKWIQTEKTPENAARRHREITNANRQLHKWLSGYQQFLENALEQSKRQARKMQILNSREYSYCLFPEAILKTFLLE